MECSLSARETHFSRREMLAAGAAVTTAPASGWTKEWDAACLAHQLALSDAAYDPAERMLARTVGGSYQYHTNARSARVHPTREALEYAFHLFEAGRDERALQVAERVIALQDQDPASKWYGIWGWYMEEPPPKMSPADWNWADFNGATLLLIHARHGARLGALRPKVEEAIRHAAYSVRRRNVSMGYTNIAVQGTFVTLAAAELLGDAELLAYARERLVRFCRRVDETGSFDEYNSPTYSRVTLSNLTRLRMLVKNEEALARAARSEARAWLHVAAHWDATRKQLAGPHSRAYSNDFGRAAWLEKALDARLGLVRFDDLRAGQAGDGETATHAWRCPRNLQERFLAPGPARLHREIFLPPPKDTLPVAGTTYLTPQFSLGSVNRGNFWVQCRPLLMYFGPQRRPPNCAQLRLLKDDYDFTSGLFYSVQRDGQVLGAVAFRTPGGDKHPSLDPVVNGQFEAARLFLRLQVDTPAIQTAEWEGGRALDAGDAWIYFAAPGARLGDTPARLSHGAERGRVNIDLDLLPPGPARTVRWRDSGSVHIPVLLAVETPRGKFQGFVQRWRAVPFDPQAFAWGGLRLRVTDQIGPAAAADRAFAAFIDGQPAPLARLSEDRLAE